MVFLKNLTNHQHISDAADLDDDASNTPKVIKNTKVKFYDKKNQYKVSKHCLRDHTTNLLLIVQEGQDCQFFCS